MDCLEPDMAKFKNIDGAFYVSTQLTESDISYALGERLITAVNLRRERENPKAILVIAKGLDSTWRSRRRDQNDASRLV